MNTNCQVRVASEFGTDLSSRARAKQLRARIAAAIDGGCTPVIIDFEGVRTLSCSFADEAFAVLIIERGEQSFSRSVNFKAANKSVADSIADAIAYRCEPA